MELGLINLSREIAYVLAAIAILFFGKLTLNLLTPF